MHGLGLNQHVKGQKWTSMSVLPPEELYARLLPPLHLLWWPPSSLWSVERDEPVLDVPRAP